MSDSTFDRRDLLRIAGALTLGATIPSTAAAANPPEDDDNDIDPRSAERLIERLNHFADQLEKIKDRLKKLYDPQRQDPPQAHAAIAAASSSLVQQIDEARTIAIKFT